MRSITDGAIIGFYQACNYEIPQIGSWKLRHAHKDRMTPDRAMIQRIEQRATDVMSVSLRAAMLSVL